MSTICIQYYKILNSFSFDWFLLYWCSADNTILPYKDQYQIVEIFILQWTGKLLGNVSVCKSKRTK